MVTLLARVGCQQLDAENNALSTWVPDHDLVLIILNDPNYGGCGGGGFATVPMGVGWQVIAHEFGHGYGGFGDEYCNSGAYSGGEPGVPNDTVNTSRARSTGR